MEQSLGSGEQLGEELRASYEVNKYRCSLN